MGTGGTKCRTEFHEAGVPDLSNVASTAEIRRAYQALGNEERAHIFFERRQHPLLQAWHVNIQPVVVPIKPFRIPRQ